MPEAEAWLRAKMKARPDEAHIAVNRFDNDEGAMGFIKTFKKMGAKVEVKLEGDDQNYADTLVIRVPASKIEETLVEIANHYPDQLTWKAKGVYEVWWD